MQYYLHYYLLRMHTIYFEDNKVIWTGGLTEAGVTVEHDSAACVTTQHCYNVTAVSRRVCVSDNVSLVLCRACPGQGFCDVSLAALIGRVFYNLTTIHGVPFWQLKIMYLTQKLEKIVVLVKYFKTQPYICEGILFIHIQSKEYN